MLKVLKNIPKEDKIKNIFLKEKDRGEYLWNWANNNRNT